MNNWLSIKMKPRQQQSDWLNIATNVPVADDEDAWLIGFRSSTRYDGQFVLQFRMNDGPVLYEVALTGPMHAPIRRAEPSVNVGWMAPKIIPDANCQVRVAWRSLATRTTINVQALIWTQTRSEHQPSQK